MNKKSNMLLFFLGLISGILISFLVIMFEIYLSINKKSIFSLLNNSLKPKNTAFVIEKDVSDIKFEKILTRSTSVK